MGQFDRASWTSTVDRRNVEKGIFHLSISCLPIKNAMGRSCFSFPSGFRGFGHPVWSADVARLPLIPLLVCVF